MNVEIRSEELFESCYLMYHLAETKELHRSREAFMTGSELHLFVNGKSIEYCRCIIDHFKTSFQVVIFYTNNQQYINELKNYRGE